MTNLFTSQVSQKIEEIIKKVQKDYPENSREAISYAITLTRIMENDYYYDKIKSINLQAEEVLKKKVEELNDVFRKHFGNGNDLWFCLNATNQIFLDNQTQQNKTSDTLEAIRQSDKRTESSDSSTGSAENTQPQNQKQKEKCLRCFNEEAIKGVYFCKTCFILIGNSLGFDMKDNSEELGR